LGYLVLTNNSKSKEEYTKTTGKIEFLEQQFKDKPNRDKGSYRYLKVDSCSYVFEIYEPNHEPISKSIDNLKSGDVIDVYFYETSNTTQEGINRFAQFIDHEGVPYFIRSGFQKQLGYIVICLGIFVNLLTVYFWRKGKLKW
jgi:hypothetical protein